MLLVRETVESNYINTLKVVSSHAFKQPLLSFQCHVSKWGTDVWPANISTENQVIKKHFHSSRKRLLVENMELKIRNSNNAYGWLRFHFLSGWMVSCVIDLLHVSCNISSKQNLKNHKLSTHATFSWQSKNKGINKHNPHDFTAVWLIFWCYSVWCVYIT